MIAFHNIKDKNEDENAAKTSEIGIIYLEEKNRVKLFSLPQISGIFSWTPDGKSFDYLENAADGAKIWRRTLDESAEAKLLLTIPKTTLYNFAWTADGKNLVLARGQQERDVILLKNFE